MNTPRYKIEVDTIPFGCKEKEYLQILDCIYEMVDMQSNCNGTSFETEMKDVISTNGWWIVGQNHQKIIIDLLKK